MPIPNREDFLRDLHESLWQVSSAGVDYRREDLGIYGFSRSASLVDNVLRFLREIIAPIELSLLPDAALEEVKAQVAILSKRLQALVIFAPGQSYSDSFDRRDSLILELDAAYNAAFRKLAPFIAVIGYTSGSGKAAEADVAAKRRELDQLLREVRGLEAKAREIMQAGGIAAHAAIFAEAAAAHQEAAHRWLTATVALAVATAAAACASIWSIFRFQLQYAALPLSLLAQLTIGKLVAISLLFSALVWTGRMYRTHRHNEVVHRHRQHALSSFEAFVKSTEDPAVRTAILLQATHSIFAPATTGYTDEESDMAASGAGAIQLGDIIRRMMDAKP